ncbi:hypothetical protein RchiOBHm_Chr6g0264571 [Rosa chinensis]|uniref:Uncharacterized protein n=1 Tax=Rosa chinensis TaxID=74649 RepID=A0A2P6PP79_ROSCH|nr:hypothetical protein RchiOBHm_Chr6g0264571 [Rosa chinensis]
MRSLAHRSTSHSCRSLFHRSLYRSKQPWPPLRCSDLYDVMTSLQPLCSYCLPKYRSEVKSMGDVMVFELRSLGPCTMFSGSAACGVHVQRGSISVPSKRMRLLYRIIKTFKAFFTSSDLMLLVFDHM